MVTPPLQGYPVDRSIVERRARARRASKQAGRRWFRRLVG